VTLSRSISTIERLTALVLILLLKVSAFAGMSTYTHASETEPQIHVIYPKPDQLVTAVDSTFIFGHVSFGEENILDKLVINGHVVEVHPDGGFLAFLPVTPGRFNFRLDAYLIEISPRQEGRRTSLPSVSTQDAQLHLTNSVTVNIPEPLPPLPLDSLIIATEYHVPTGDIVLATGDMLEVSFRGTPGCRAWFDIAGVADSIPMVETAPCLQAYWGESVFGAGAVPDSMKVTGIYSGFYEIPAGARADSVRIQYHLVPPLPVDIIRRFLFKPFDPADIHLTKFLSMGDTTVKRRESSYTVTINDPSYPFTVRFVDSVQIIRYGPRRGYLSIFQPEGVEVLAVGAEGEWYKIKLSKSQVGWVKEASVERLPKGILPPNSYLSLIRTYGDDDKLVVKFPLSGKHPFRIIEDDKRTVRIQLFGVTSNTDWIRYDFTDKLIRLATWSQPEEGLYELKLELTQDIWGYDSYYKGNTFYFQLNKPPSHVRKLKGKTIVVDPGHSKDPGAIGPTGYTEAEANLAIALALRKELQSKGANVVMTREDNSHVELYDRPMIAKLNDADLFVSIHNNAVPDGVNPFTNNGTSSYYYHPHSIDLARYIHTEMLKATGLPDHGLYHGNLAVNRPTQYPAVLVECAFMMIPQQEAMLKTDKFRKKVAKAILKGISNFLKEYNNGD
jgi:N-acetylmuramoyl-L-alanine amidase